MSTGHSQFSVEARNWGYIRDTKAEDVRVFIIHENGIPVRSVEGIVGLGQGEDQWVHVWECSLSNPVCSVVCLFFQQRRKLSVWMHCDKGCYANSTGHLQVVKWSTPRRRQTKLQLMKERDSRGARRRGS